MRFHSVYTAIFNINVNYYTQKYKSTGPEHSSNKLLHEFLSAIQEVYIGYILNKDAEAIIFQNMP